VVGPNDDLEARVSALESQIRLVRDDAAAARVLAGGADRDVSALAAKLDAHTRVLNALRETQLEQGMAIGELSHRMDGLTHRVDGLTHRVDGLSQRIDGLEHEMRQGFAMMATGMARITALLEDPGGSQPD
jgi:outer membrane murein-binding lipoprotein Lpp